MLAILKRHVAKVIQGRYQLIFHEQTFDMFGNIIYLYMRLLHFAVYCALLSGTFSIS